jgi:hypothetical protein
LLPAVKVGPSFLSWNESSRTLYLDLPSGEFTDRNMRGAAANGGCFEGPAEALKSALCFLGACAESRSHGLRRNGDPMSGENANLFVPEVGEWAEENSDEIGMLQLELSGEFAE